MSPAYVLLYSFYIRCYISCMTSLIPHVSPLGRNFLPFHRMCLRSRDGSPSRTIVSIRVIAVATCSLNQSNWPWWYTVKYVVKAIMKTHSLVFQSAYIRIRLLHILLLSFNCPPPPPLGHGHMTCGVGSFGICELSWAPMEAHRLCLMAHSMPKALCHVLQAVPQTGVVGRTVLLGEPYKVCSDV